MFARRWSDGSHFWLRTQLTAQDGGSTIEHGCLAFEFKQFTVLVFYDVKKINPLDLKCDQQLLVLTSRQGYPGEVKQSGLENVQMWYHILSTCVKGNLWRSVRRIEMPPQVETVIYLHARYLAKFTILN